MVRARKQGSNGVDYGGAHAKKDYRNHGKSSSSVGYIVGAGVVSIALIAGMGVVTVNTMDNMREHAASMQTATAAIGDDSVNSSTSSSNKSDGSTGVDSASSSASTSESGAASNKSDSSASSSSDSSSSSSSSSDSGSATASDSNRSEASDGSAVVGLDPADAEESKRRAEAIIAEKGGHIYYVHYGDTLSGISAQTGVSVQKIANINEIDNIHLIYADSALVIPD